MSEHPIYGEFGRSYYPLIFGETHRDESFVVLRDGRPALIVPCTVGGGALDWFGLPIRLFAAGGPQVRDAIDATFNHIDALAEEHGFDQITIRGDIYADDFCADYGLERVDHQSALVDLALDEVQLRAALRRRYRNYVNWGSRELEIKRFDAEHPDRAIFESYRGFHREIAGRVTRPAASWDLMADWIAAGRGSLICGYLDGKLVASAVTVDGTRTAYYASGVYDRALFDKGMPLAHAPIWLSILAARDRGLAIYDVGDVTGDGASAKETTIGFFKRGFASRIEQWPCWVSRPTPTLIGA